jgi:hypothetical protein
MAVHIPKAKQLRIQAAVIHFLIRGINDFRTCQVLSQKYGVSKAYIQKVIKYIYQTWTLSGEQDMRIKRSRAILARRAIISSAWLGDNLELALRAEDSLAMIEGTKYSELISDDPQMQFEITVKKAKGELDGYSDEIDHPGEFEKRQKRQMEEFTKRFAE